jgi:hypothetical protein
VGENPTRGAIFVSTIINTVMNSFRRIFSIFLIALFVVLFSGCATSRQEELTKKDVETYSKLIEELQKLNITDKSQFLSGHAVMAHHILYTFENLPKSSRNRAVMVADAIYWCPTKNWLENTLLPYCQKVFSDRNARF